MITRYAWTGMTPDERVRAVQNLEFSEAVSQGRAPYPVFSEEMGPGDMGYYDGQKIAINQDLFLSDSPHDCLETYFHEERHAQQEFAAAHPELTDDPEQAQEWANSFDNYIKPEEDFVAYENQPVEVDAREYAAQRMEQYEEQMRGYASSDEPEEQQTEFASEGQNDGHGYASSNEPAAQQAENDSEGEDQNYYAGYGY